MILRTANGNVWSLHFRHSTDLMGRRMTACTVHGGMCPKNVRPCVQLAAYTGFAHCAKRDAFCRATGRKVALTRALVTLDKPTRTEIWSAYRNYNPIDEMFRKLLHAESGRWKDNRSVGEST